MRVFVVTIAVVLVPLTACKKRPAEDAAADASLASPRESQEQAIDALNPPPPPADLAQRADTVNGDPNGPKSAELDAANADGQRRVQLCLDALARTAIPGGTVRLVVRYVVGNEGKARDISVEGGSAEANACGKSGLEATAFPKFSGSPLANAFSLTYSRPSPPPDLAGPTRP